jgi:hypothetical protein
MHFVIIKKGLCLGDWDLAKDQTNLGCGFEYNRDLAFVHLSMLMTYIDVECQYYLNVRRRELHVVIR